MRGKSTLLPEQSKKFPEFYKKLNPNWTDEQCIEAAKQFKKTTNWQCIEYWHCNPKFYTGEFVNKNKNMLAKEIWEYDKIKTQAAMKYSYLVLTIWESEYNENKEEITKKMY